MISFWKTDYWGCPVSTAGLAVDGGTNAKFSGCTCAHTNEPVTERPWWIVDLLDKFVIYNVIIYNREDQLGKFIVL